VQIIGGIVAAFTLSWILGGTGTGLGATKLAQSIDLHGTTVSVSNAAGLIVELLITFFLANAVLNAGISGKATIPGGLAIGLTLSFGILFAFPLTGGSANPARTIGPYVALGNFDGLWVYLVGQALGGIIAGLLYRSVLEDRATA
jgi:glycerol uptake facilitator-like aquaporin